MSVVPPLTGKAAVLSLYRRMLKSAGKMTGKQRDSSLKLIREEFRKNADEHNPESVRKMLEKANSSLSYIKIVTPKSGQEQTGKIHIANGDTSRPNRAHTNWTGKNMDPDSVARHYHGLKRAGFQNNAHAKGIF